MKSNFLPCFVSICFLSLSLDWVRACGPGTNTIDNLPTLGGSGFQVNSLSASGHVTGFSYMPGDTTAHAFLYNAGVMSDLGTLGGSVSIGHGVNTNGHVVGESGNTGDLQTRAFLYDGSGMHDLGTLGGSYSSAVAINNAGQIAGTANTPDEFNQAFLYQNGSMAGLGDLGSGFSQAVAINQLGTVMGDSYTVDFYFHGFIYKNGSISDLGTLGGSDTTVYALNNQDTITGESSTSSGNTHAFLYSGGSMVDLQTLGGNYSSGRALNDSGEVVGVSTTAANQSHGFIYRSGGMTDLSTLGGASTTPFAINNSGQVVGESRNAASRLHAFSWKDGAMSDLNDALPASSGWELSSAQFINDAGQIVGYGKYNAQDAWFIMTPASANNPPVAVAGADQVVECPSAVTLDGSASSDPDGDSLTFEWSFLGSVLGTTATLTTSLPLGTNAITLKVTDACGSSAQAQVTVRVVDTTAPTGTCPVDVTASANADCQAPVPNLFPLVVANDNCTPQESLMVVQQPSAGTLVGLGPHPISISVTDASGNTSGCSVLFTVSDTTDPVILSTPGPVNLANCQAALPDLTAAVVATDNCTPANQLSIVQTPAPGTVLGVGQHNVSISVTDLAGNVVSTSVQVTVVGGGTAPTLESISATPSVLFSPNHQLVPIQVSVVASDSCDPAPVSQIISITSNEALSPGEAQITGPLTSLLAASRDPHGDGRTYTLIVQCTNASGNSSLGSVSVFVPKSNGNGGGGGKK